MEGRVYEVSKDLKAAVSQITFLINTLQQDLEKTVAQRDGLMSAADKRYEKSLHDFNTALIHRIDSANNDHSVKLQRTQEGIKELQDLLKWEVASREQAVTTTQEMLAQEHCRREQDEATIITVMENVMKRQLAAGGPAAVP